jgi:hypothetical protein
MDLWNGERKYKDNEYFNDSFKLYYKTRQTVDTSYLIILSVSLKEHLSNVTSKYKVNTIPHLQTLGHCHMKNCSLLQLAKLDFF